MNVNPRIDNIMVIIMSVPLLSLNVSEYSSPRKTTSAPKMPPHKKDLTLRDLPYFLAFSFMRVLSFSSQSRQR